MQQETKDKLKILNEDYKSAITALNDLYGKNRTLVIQEAKELTETFAEKLEHSIDSVTLAMCAPFEKKANKIRWKRKDPDGYSSYWALVYIEKFFKKALRTSVKKGKVSNRTFKKVKNFMNTCDLILSDDKYFGSQKMAQEVRSVGETILCEQEVSENKEDEATKDKLNELEELLKQSFISAGVPASALQG